MHATYRDSHDRAACRDGTGQPAAAGKVKPVRKVQAVSAAFRNILLVVFLIFVFAVVQTVMLWRVCNAGMQTATSLEHGGLPALNTLASLQEHLALYRLYSYEYLFAREQERAGKAKAAAAMAAQIRAELKEIKGLLPDEKGRLLASNLEGAVDGLDSEFQKVRDMVDTDFAAAMKEMDLNIPARTDRVAAAAAALKDYGYNFSSSQANAAFGSFGWIKNYASISGVANILVAFGSVLFVLLAARRSSAQLSGTLARLDGRTNELQHANDALQKEVIEHLRAQETLRESEEKFSGAFEHAPIGVALVSEEGRWMKVNKSTCDILGYSAAELLGGNFQDITHPDDLAADIENVHRLLAGEVNAYSMEKRFIHAKGHTVAVLLHVSLVRDPAGKPLYFIKQIEDISARKRAEVELETAHRRLLDLSRQAGMAEVATSVLHNVGNVLNSVNISASLVMDGLQLSQCGALDKVAALLEQNSANLGDFFSNDTKGKQLPGFIRLLSTTLVQEQETAVQELKMLCKHIDHIKEIVSKQQSYAKIFGVSEVVEVVDLVEDSIEMNAGALARHDVDILRDYHKVPPINIEKHKVLQILVNLIRNAKYACDDGAKPVKQMTVRVEMGDGCIRIAVIDNGIGIPAENLTRIFNHGFTTRKTGHGFGLHNGALTAKELGGSLIAHSDGSGAGATFTLELPITR